MKRYMFLLLLIVGIQTVLCAQSDCAGKGTVTNPTSPYIPDKIGTSEEVNQLFDWRLQTVGWPYKPYGATTSTTIRNPFNETSNGDAKLLAKGLASDFNPQDGWELLKIDLGYLVNGITPRNDYTNGQAAIPYVLLYNKYRGKLRVFAYYSTQSANMLLISIGFNKGSNGNTLYTTGNMAFSSTFATPLDAPPSMGTSIVCTPYGELSGGTGTFSYGEFDIAYDPCICNFNSEILVSFQSVLEGNLELTGTLFAEMKTIPTKPTQSGMNQALAILGAGAKVGANIALLSSGNPVGAIGLIGSIPDFINAIASTTKLSSDDKKELQDFATLSNQVSGSVENVYSIYKAIYKPEVDASGKPMTPKGERISTALGKTNTFISDKLIKKANAGIPGSYIQGGMKIQGTNNFRWEPIANKIPVPGSKDAYRYPLTYFISGNTNTSFLDGRPIPEGVLYNEPLGVFNLMETPIAYMNVIENNNNNIRYQWTIDPKTIKLIFNKNLDIKSTDVKGALRVRTWGTTPDMPLTAVEEGDNASYLLVHENTSQGLIGKYSEERIDMESVEIEPGDNLGGWAIGEKFNPILRWQTFSTDYQDFDKMSYLAPTMYHHHWYTTNDPQYSFKPSYWWAANDIMGHNRVYVSLMVDVEYNKIGTDGLPIHQFFVATFPCKLQYNANNPTPWAVSSRTAFGTKPSYLEIFTSTSVYNTPRTAYEVVINGNLSFASGQSNGSFTAFQNIEMLKNTNISPEMANSGTIKVDPGLTGTMEFKVNDVLDPNRYVPSIITLDEVKQFCANSSKYKSKMAVLTSVARFSDEYKSDAFTSSVTTISAYPNPIKEGKLHFSQQVSRYQLFDASGTNVANGEYTDGLDISNFSKGLYIIILDGQSQKIIIE